MQWLVLIMKQLSLLVKVQRKTRKGSSKLLQPLLLYLKNDNVTILLNKIGKIKIIKKMKLRRPKSSISQKQALQKSQVILKTSIDLSSTTQNHGPAQIKSYSHSTPPKNYRINQQQVYNYVRNSVAQTFKLKTSRNYDLVKQLTDISAPGRNQIIDRLCKKYSILRSNRRSCFENVQVNIQQITNRYVKSRSKQKQDEEKKARLKKDISANYRYGRKKQYEQSEMFFSFDGNQLKRLQKKHFQKQSQKKREEKLVRYPKSTNKIHPYLELYEKAQMEALSSLANRSSLEVIPAYPEMPEQQDWLQNEKGPSLGQKLLQEQQKQIHKKRQIQSARSRFSGKGTKQDFYLS